MSARDEQYFDNPAMYSAIIFQIWIQSTPNISQAILTEMIQLAMEELNDFLKFFNAKYQLEVYSDYLRFNK
jgi:hypothetical protein